MGHFRYLNALFFIGVIYVFFHAWLLCNFPGGI